MNGERLNTLAILDCAFLDGRGVRVPHVFTGLDGDLIWLDDHHVHYLAIMPFTVFVRVDAARRGKCMH